MAFILPWHIWSTAWWWYVIPPHTVPLSPPHQSVWTKQCSDSWMVASKLLCNDSTLNADLKHGFHAMHWICWGFFGGVFLLFQRVFRKSFFKVIHHHAWSVRLYSTYSLIFLMLIYVPFTFITFNWWCIINAVHYFFKKVKLTLFIQSFSFCNGLLISMYIHI